MTLYNETKGGQLYRKYPYELPFRITWENNNQDIVKKLGDSKVKGGGSIPVWINYEHLGIKVEFLRSSWEDIENPLSSITLFRPTKKQTECTLCLKPLPEAFHIEENRCSKCKLCFCSVKCLQSFREVHTCPGEQS